MGKTDCSQPAVVACQFTTSSDGTGDDTDVEGPLFQFFQRVMKAFGALLVILVSENLGNSFRAPEPPIQLVIIVRMNALRFLETNKVLGREFKKSECMKMLFSCFG